MKLLFKGGSEQVYFDLNRKDKVFKFASSKTNYDVVNKKWRQLFDSGKEKVQELVTDRMTDEEFKNEIVAQMQKVGYLLVDKNDRRSKGG